MEYRPMTAVWEITMGCNLRCMHCGSACESALPDELTTDEALKLCDDLGKMGLQWITLSGGEPTTRHDWDKIAARLYQNGIIPNIITNGWIVNDEVIERASAAHVNTMAFSIDGIRETHDSIRKTGSFDRIINALDLINGSSVNCSVITTVNNRNIAELPEILKILEDKGVVGWQLQIGLPMGTMAVNRELVAGPECIDTIINFAHENYETTHVDIQLADCIGYFNVKEMEVRRKGKTEEGYDWDGCGAGKKNLGILHNGLIVGCTSVRDNEFIEGSIRERPLKEIWDDHDSFAWNRKFKKENLLGFCSRCRYGSACLGGCGNTRLTMNGTVYGENRYCSYNLAFTSAEKKLGTISDISTVVSRARKFIDNGNLQLAELILRKGLELQSEDREMLGLYGFVCYKLENFQDAKLANEKLLEINGNDPYANKGMGLTLCRMGMIEEGIEHLHKAIEFSSLDFMDPYYDLALELIENDRKEDALDVLNRAKEKSPEFFEKCRGLYNQLV